MLSSAEFYALATAIVGNAVALLGGILGILFTALGVYKRATPSGKVALTFGFLALLMAPVMAWRDTYRELEAKTKENTKLSERLEDRDKQIADMNLLLHKAELARSDTAARGCPPSGVSAHAAESITVSSTPVGFSESRFRPRNARQAVAAQATVENGSIRISDSGDAPLHHVDPGMPFWVCGESLQKFRAVRDGQADAILRVTYYW